MTHHLHPDPAVDDMLRAANARAEAAEAERDEARETVVTLREAYREAIGVPVGEHQSRRMEQIAEQWEAERIEAADLRRRAETLERTLAEQQAAVLALADEWSDWRTWEGAAGSALRAALSDPTALDALIARERATALREAAERFRTDAAAAWGGDSRWLTTGTNVADLAAVWCEESADALAAEAER